MRETEKEKRRNGGDRERAHLEKQFECLEEFHSYSL